MARAFHRSGAAVLKTMGLGMVLLFASSVSNAGSYDSHPCGNELNDVESAILYANFTGKRAATDQSNLLAKLAAADSKITLKKYSDAVDKLLNISDTATALADAPKPKLEDASGINDAVTVAIGCVGNLQ